MPRGKKRLADRPVEWKLHVPQSIAAEINLLLSDPVTGKPKHGARSALTVKLYREYLASLKTEKDNV